MKLTRAMAVIFGLGGCVCSTSAWAQAPAQPRYDANSYNSPPISPYLLMLPQATSAGGSVGAAPGTYQTLVRPLLEARDEKNRQAISPAPSAAAAASTQKGAPQTTGFTGTIRPTGHSATFLNTSHYYTAHKP